MLAVSKSAAILAAALLCRTKVAMLLPHYLLGPMSWHHCIQIFLGLITFGRYGSPDSSNRVDVDVTKIILFS